MSETVGFIGLGTMGFPMARNLAAAGVALVVYDAKPEVIEEAGKLPGVQAAASPREVAERSAVVFTCLPDNGAVEAVYRGEEGITRGAKAGLITCDCSTVSPEVSIGLAEELQALGMHHMDTPMLGSQPQAQSGEIFFIVAGEQERLPRIAPALEIMGRMHMYVGPSGTGNKIKLIHNALGDVIYTAVAESLALGAKSGVDLNVLYEVVRNGGGMAYSTYFERKVPKIIQGDFTPNFRLDLAFKDITLARAFSDQVGVPVPLMEEARRTFEEAVRDGHGAADACAVSHVIEKRIGRSLSQG